jgi:hypothetical protein
MPRGWSPWFIPKGQWFSVRPSLGLRVAHETTPEVIQIGIAMAVENIENFARGAPMHVVVCPKG